MSPPRRRSGPPATVAPLTRAASSCCRAHARPRPARPETPAPRAARRDGPASRQPTDPHKPRLQGSGPDQGGFRCKETRRSSPASSPATASPTRRPARNRTSAPPSTARILVLDADPRDGEARTPPQDWRRPRRHSPDGPDSFSASPPPPWPPRQFEEQEPLSYDVPAELLTGQAEVDEANDGLANFYSDIAYYRKSIYDQKRGGTITDQVSFNRSVAPTRALIQKLRKDAEDLIKIVEALPGRPKVFQEPLPFKIDM